MWRISSSQEDSPESPRKIACNPDRIYIFKDVFTKRLHVLVEVGPRARPTPYRDGSPYYDGNGRIARLLATFILPTGPDVLNLLNESLIRKTIIHLIE